jgi:hypothetical protein
MLNVGNNTFTISWYSWTFDFATTNIGTTSTVLINDTNFDIYIME